MPASNSDSHRSMVSSVEPASPHRSIARLIATGSLLFTILVAIGTYLRSGRVVPAVVTVACGLMFLALWHYVTVKHASRVRPESTSQSASTSAAGSWMAWSSAALAILAWILAIIGDLSPPSSAAGALRLLTATAGSGLLAFLLAIVVVSNPEQTQRARGAMLGLCATVGLVLYLLMRLVLHL